jgi:2-keto-3-deoxy-L-rhamnonate aldolase RhmA
MNKALRFGERLRAKEALLASFIKTPGVHGIEIAGLAGLDAVVIDAEHAPFSANALDLALLAARAAGIAAIVRVPDARAATIGAALDLGAAGVLVPHVCSVDDAKAAAAAARYLGGRRGFSNSPRAGGYGMAAMAEHIDQQDRSALVLCQIEDAVAVDSVEAIAAVPGVDCLFVGRADLAVSHGLTQLSHARVLDAQARTFQAAAQAGVCAGIFVGDTAEVDTLRRAGCSFFVVGSDQSVLRTGFRALRTAFDRS